jgi:hypothetical protein
MDEVNLDCGLQISDCGLNDAINVAAGFSLRGEESHNDQ